MPDPSAAPVPSPSSPVRIILVDDDPLTRAAIKPLLRPREDYAVVAEAGDGRQAIEAVERVEADIVLMDLGMPVMDGIEATRQICAAPRHPHVVALTTWDVDDAVVRVIEAGAVGYLLKYSASEELDAGLRRVMMGESVLSPGALAELLRYVRSQPAVAAPVVAAYDARAEERQRAVAQARQAAAGLSPARARCHRGGGRGTDHRGDRYPAVHLDLHRQDPPAQRPGPGGGPQPGAPGGPRRARRPAGVTGTRPAPETVVSQGPVI
ncbi:response regulator receiver domain protein [Actinomyces naeslundii str. Howell 279]|uniref:Response regulator receiver domain protein n=1 Tax=Actinomyces naeslundii (strain ATCC 12104 / DSM 43013 / CCUG 2238 / JCM 8349 / NCTC 10301 / Howell 279) TaxID=1115803 RepID=J3F2F6_ACTNH|nr:response regulator receiver domain protein [Actinomyces naeslundii str. Howell 279]